MSEKKRFLLRLDPELYKVLEKWAADEFRSVNAQIELLLKMSAKKAGRIRKTVTGHRKKRIIHVVKIKFYFFATFDWFTRICF